jgi:hypothetical protein
MRHVAILSVLFCTYATAALGQGLTTGVRGGMNLATNNTIAEGEGAGLGWQPRGVFGGFLTWRAASWIELQPEVLYSMKGGKREEFDISSKLLLDYLDVPLLARLSRGARGSRSWYVVGGPSFGYLLRARTRADFGNATEEIDIIEDVERFEFSVVAGGGLEFTRVLIDARYTHGLSNIDKLAADGDKMTNRAVSVTAGIKF